MKRKEWALIRPKLLEEYEERGTTSCEACGGSFALSLHHLDRRSSGRAKNTYEGTVLLCYDCHFKADQAPGFKEFNEELRKLR